MIIDLDPDALVTIEIAFGWGDNSCIEGYIDTEKNECVLLGAVCPYTYKLPSDKVLLNGENGWEIRDSSDYFHYKV